MPNWEWRAFIQASPDTKLPGEVWSLLGVSPGVKEADRTDVYLTCTSGAGLKLRYGQEVEIKLKLKTDGEAECWKKVVCRALPRGVDTQDSAAIAEMFKRELLRIQAMGGRDGFKESLDEALAALAKPQKLVTITKSRIKAHTFQLSVDSVEEVVVCVNVGCEAVGVWRSVCLEACKADRINQTLAMRVTPETGAETSLRDCLLSQNSRVQSYPQFVLQDTAVLEHKAT